MQNIFMCFLFVAAYAASTSAQGNYYQTTPQNPYFQTTTTQSPYYQTTASSQNVNSYGGSSSSFSSSSASSFNSISNQYGNTNKGTKKPSTSGNTEKGVVERFTHRYPDGSYEYRYELADGTARYERGYFLLVDRVKSLVVVGYYSYRMPDGRYITVFYNADQHGYRQNQSITPQTYPNLPRTIEVPESKELQDYASTTQSSRIPITTTTRRNYY